MRLENRRDRVGRTSDIGPGNGSNREHDATPCSSTEPRPLEGDLFRNGDIVAAVRGLVRARALMLDPERVLAHVVELACLDTRPPRASESEWIQILAARVIASLLAEDAQREEHCETGPPRPGDLVVALLGVPAERALAVTVAFNSIPRPVRTTFFDLLVDRREIEEYADDSALSITTIRARIQHVFYVVARAAK
jgi:hypothetical protein